MLLPVRTLKRIAPFCLALLPFMAFGADQWLKITTPHFELYTSAGEKKGRETILYFEQVRSFFQQSSVHKSAPEFPVRIIVFRSEKQYAPYRISEAAAAYFVGNENRDYIVMGSIAPENFPIAIHEYVHLIVRHSGTQLPVWLNEGMAELYSTLRPTGKKAMVGEMIPGRAQVLLQEKWLPLSILTSVDEKSPLYNEKNKAGIFYAESWALTHMLELSPEYRPKSSEFLAAIDHGKDTPAAFRDVYGKSLPEVQDDLHAYIRGNRFFAAVFDSKLEKSEEEPDIAEVSPFEANMALADLLATIGKSAEAESMYAALAKEAPQNPEIEESLGYMWWQKGDINKTRAHFARALELGTKNAKMCYQFAALQPQTSAPNPEVVAALKRAIALKPDYADAHLALGFAALKTRDFEVSLAAFRHIKNLKPDQAYSYYSGLAYAANEVGFKDEAKHAVASAWKYAKGPEQTEQAEQLSKYINQEARIAKEAKEAEVTPKLRHAPEVVAEQPVAAVVSRNPFAAKDEQLQRAEGTLKQFDCAGKSPRLHVATASGTLVLSIPDPKRVLIRNSTASFEFTCGPQKPLHVTVEYAATKDAAAKNSGILRGLDF